MNPITAELVRICRYFGAFEREAVCCGTVTVPQCLVMQELLAEGPRDVSRLAAFAGTSVSAMTRLVDGLAKRGFVERNRDPDDRRRVVVTLTEPGTAEAQRLLAMTDAGVQRVLAHVPVADRADVARVITILREAMDRADLGRGCC